MGTRAGGPCRPVPTPWLGQAMGRPYAPMDYETNALLSIVVATYRLSLPIAALPGQIGGSLACMPCAIQHSRAGIMLASW